MAGTGPALGQRVSYNSTTGTVRYIGPVGSNTTVEWLGVEWDDPTRGKHDGSHQGKRYFTCTSTKDNEQHF